VSFESMREDSVRARRLERRMLVVSLAAHALLFLFILRLGPATNAGSEITEVALLQPGDGFEPSSPAPSAPAAPAPQTQSGVRQPRESEMHFRRETRANEMQPDPQSATAFNDQLNSRLATLQSAAVQPTLGLATVAPSVPKLASPAGLNSPIGTGRGGTIALQRGGTGTGAEAPPLALGRGAGGSGSELALAALPAERPSSRPAAAPRAASPRQALAGVSLAGPIADRAVLEAVNPTYPEWAKSEAVEGAVTLYFIVLPDGTVKDNVLVQKTAGFSDFDDGAMQALRGWRFAPLPPGRTGDQWGTITFRYRLADAR
jgi:TonB family protein